CQIWNGISMATTINNEQLINKMKLSKISSAWKMFCG
ncbi:hypothetical protein D018_2062B, partial [Vibrio parahaemolyticus VP2007-007]